MALGAVARDHPMEVGPVGKRRARRANQGELIFGRVELGDVGGETSPAWESQRRPDVERRGGGPTHLVGIDTGRNDLHFSRRKPGGEERRPHGLGDRHDRVRVAQRAATAHREYDSTRRDHTRRRARVAEEATSPDRERDGVVVMSVNEIGTPGQGFDDKPPPGPWVEPEAPGDLTDGQDRKSTRLNSSHSQISYAVFCLKKKKLRDRRTPVRPHTDARLALLRNPVL